MSIEAMNWAYQQKVGRPTAKAILISLANQANQDGQCWPSIDYTAKRVEVTSRSVIANLKYLADKDFLKKQIRAGDGGGRKSNFYTLNMRQSEPISQRGMVNEDHQQSEPDTGQSERRSPKQSITVIEQSLFEQTRKINPKNPNDNRRTALKAWNARIREGADANELLEGRKRYAAYCLAEQAEPRYIKHDSTFFGPNRILGATVECSAESP